MDDIAPAIGPETVILPMLNGMAHLDILGARFGAQSTLAVLEQEGVRVVRLYLPADFDGIRVWTRMIAALLGAQRREVGTEASTMTVNTAPEATDA